MGALWVPFALTLDSTGAGSANLGAPSLGENWLGFVTLNSAPAGQVCTITVGGSVVASGGRQTGAFAAGSGQAVTLQVSGGTASAQLAGVLQGTIAQGVVAGAPLPSAGSLVEISGGTVTVDDVGGTVTVQPAAGTKFDMTGQVTFPSAQNIQVVAGQNALAIEMSTPGFRPGIPVASFSLPSGTASVARSLPAQFGGGPADLTVVVENYNTLSGVVAWMENTSASQQMGEALYIPTATTSPVSGVVIPARGTLSVLQYQMAGPYGALTLTWVNTPASGLGVSAWAYASNFVPETASFYGPVSGAVLVPAPPDGQTLWYLGAEMSAEPSSATMPAYGAILLQGSSSLHPVWYQAFNWNTNTGTMAIVYPYQHVRPLRLPSGLDGIALNLNTSAISSGPMPYLVGIIRYLYGI